MFSFICIEKNGTLYDYRTDYFVSDEGYIFSNKKGRVKKRNFGIDKAGYNNVCLSLNGKVITFLVHRIVANAFIPNPQNKPCVNHKDGNKNNNDISNLEWCTYSENEKHSYSALGKINSSAGTGKFGSLNVNSKPIIAIKDGNEHYFESIKMCAAALGIFDSNINKVLKGKYKHSGGYTFKYA
jgi:hypothetical protein